MKDIKRFPTALAATLFSCLAVACLAGGPESTPVDDPHAGISCTKCHRGSAKGAIFTSGADGADPRSRACRACHGDMKVRSASATAMGFHGSDRGDCAGCHSFHQAGQLKSVVGEVSLGPGLRQVVAGHCASCHVKGARLTAMTGAHRTAAGLYHKGAAALVDQSPSEGCLNCHSDRSATDWQQQTAEDRLAFSEHATHPIGVEVVAGSGQDEGRIREDIDPRLRLFNGRIECQTCHVLTASTPDLLVEFTPAGGLCQGCHQLRNDPVDRSQALMATMVKKP